MMMGPDAPDFGAASDGDGDRNLVVAASIFVTPSDSLAVLAANAHLAPGYARGLAGVARSMPTSAAVDRVAAELGVDCYETPTGWKFFGNLLDAGRITLCGEESSAPARITCARRTACGRCCSGSASSRRGGKASAELARAHWGGSGATTMRATIMRASIRPAAQALMASLGQRLPGLAGTALAADGSQADDFGYTYPVDGSVSTDQGLRVIFEDGARIVYRLSGTGTAGATLRVYLEHYEADPTLLAQDTQAALADLIATSRDLARLNEFTGREEPDVIT